MTASESMGGVVETKGEAVMNERSPGPDAGRIPPQLVRRLTRGAHTGAQKGAHAGSDTRNLTPGGPTMDSYIIKHTLKSSNFEAYTEMFYRKFVKGREAEGAHQRPTPWAQTRLTSETLYQGAHLDGKACIENFP